MAAREFLVHYLGLLGCSVGCQGVARELLEELLGS